MSDSRTWAKERQDEQGLFVVPEIKKAFFKK
jgi:hypothetical protein